MSGQWRALSIAALACALTLSGCSLAGDPTPAPDPSNSEPATRFTDTETESILELCDLPATGAFTQPVIGGLVYTYENGTAGRISFANDHCVLDTNFVTLLRPALTDEQLMFLYDYYRSTTAPCLLGFGYPVLSPPTRGAFVESGGDWSPWDSVFAAMMDVKEIAALSRNCPRYPPGQEWANLEAIAD